MDIKIDKAEWEKLGSAEQQRVSGIISEHFNGSTIVPDGAGTTQVTGICTTLCGIAEAAAIKACGGNSICVTAAQIAGAACRAACG